MINTSNHIPFVHGEGLKQGVVGLPILFTIDGRNADRGRLNCWCRAPSGMMTYLLIVDNKDGTYTVDLNTCEVGMHTVEIEWDDVPIPASPFQVKIYKVPQVRKIRVYGPGLNSQVIGPGAGIFQVDMDDTGAIKIQTPGPKSSYFKVALSPDHPSGRVIKVKFNTMTPGVYTASVLWSNEDVTETDFEHVTGSPFEIFIAINKEHLDKWNKVIKDIKILENSL